MPCPHRYRIPTNTSQTRLDTEKLTAPTSVFLQLSLAPHHNSLCSLDHCIRSEVKGGLAVNNEQPATSIVQIHYAA
jgi:hypothetical protein